MAMVTGPSSGIGRAVALELGRHGYHVVAAGRSAERTMPVVDLIEDAGGSAEFLHLDLASLASAAKAAEEFAASGRTLDLLVNNAGVGGKRGTTADGFEIHFGVNHLGHHMLTRGLLPALVSGARLVQVSSAAHFNAAGIDFTDVTRRTKSLLGWSEYGVSKLANVLFVRELARRNPELAAYAVHPGTVDTGIFPWFIKPLIRHRLLSPDQGAETVLWCATSQDAESGSGLYFRRKEPVPPSDAALDDALAAELWERSEKWCEDALGRVS